MESVIKALVLLICSRTFITKFVFKDEDPATHDTVLYLKNLTKIIEKCITIPEEENGNILLKSLYEYYNNLDDVYWMAKDEEKGRRDRGFKLLCEVIENGKPIQFNKTINYDTYKAVFQWNDRSVQEMYDAVKSTKLLWEKVESEYNNLLFEDSDFITLPPNNK